MAEPEQQPWSGGPQRTPWAAGRLSAGRRPQLLFGWMYEDHGVELAAFPPASRVLAIASAGDTVAALARAGHRVTAVDVNPVQLGYARARLAGAPAVPGVAERILAAGRVAAGAVLAGWRPAAMERFLRLADPAGQADWWRRELDRPALRGLLAAALRPAGLLACGLRGGLRAAIPPRLDVALRRRVAAGVARYPNAGNPWAWRLLLGRDPADPAGPADPVGAAGAAPGPAPAVEWRHADVVRHLRDVPAGWYDAATLSNVLDGPSPAFADQLRAALRHGVRPGGPVVLRTFRARPVLPGQLVADRSLLWGAVTLLRSGG
jgi:S-adenosylmethionine:diacylglycerol 3-amino-3-carboxypropyl transferase